VNVFYRFRGSEGALISSYARMSADNFVGISIGAGMGVVLSLLFFIYCCDTLRTPQMASISRRSWEFG
jgi:hypothetical protein